MWRVGDSVIVVSRWRSCYGVTRRKGKGKGIGPCQGGRRGRGLLLLRWWSGSGGEGLPADPVELQGIDRRLLLSCSNSSSAEGGRMR